MKYLLLPLVVVALVLGNSYSGHAQSEVTLVAPGAIGAAVNQLTPSFEQKTGLKVKGTFGPGLKTMQQVIRGEAFDVSIVTPPYPELLASGNVVASSATLLATDAIGVAVRKGAPKPDISTPKAVKRMLLAAKSIAYPDAAQSLAGVRVEEALKKLGITGQIEPKAKHSRGGPGVMAMVAKGEADIGMAVLSEMTDPGVDVIGTLPREISTPPSFVGFVCAHAKDPAAAKALLDYLSSPDAAAAYKAHGMQPAH